MPALRRCWHWHRGTGESRQACSPASVCDRPVRVRVRPRPRRTRVRVRMRAQRGGRTRTRTRSGSRASSRFEYPPTSDAEAHDGERVQIHTTHTIPAICDELQPQTKPQVTPPDGASDDAEVRKVPLTEVFSLGPPLQHGYGHWYETGAGAGQVRGTRCRCSVLDAAPRATQQQRQQCGPAPRPQRPGPLDEKGACSLCAQAQFGVVGDRSGRPCVGWMCRGLPAGGDQ